MQITMRCKGVSVAGSGQTNVSFDTNGVTQTDPGVLSGTMTIVLAPGTECPYVHDQQYTFSG